MDATRGPGIVVNPGGPSAPGRIFEAAFRGVVRPVLRGFPINRMTLPVGAALIDGLAMLRPEPAGIDREQVSMTGFRMEIVRPAGAARALRHGAVLYFHGGGFAICGLRTHRPVAAGLARRTGLPVEFSGKYSAITAEIPPGRNRTGSPAVGNRRGITWPAG
ncbi:alpha/beta hydrolase [Nocardia cyriacigeorgica]|uniref:alpha/beta hydrolase n=1 Tax=Nocardia cyriacigeorgica TaxID=135487 RepID=UPI003518E803